MGTMETGNVLHLCFRPVLINTSYSLNLLEQVSVCYMVKLMFYYCTLPKVVIFEISWGTIKEIISFCRFYCTVEVSGL